jgi:hypothetical protein
MSKKQLITEALEGPTTTTDTSSEEGYIYVSRVAYGDEQVETTPIKVADFKGQPTGRVAVTAQYTKNLGNYESAKIGIEISLPVLASEEEVVRVYDKIQTLVSDILSEQISAVSK